MEAVEKVETAAHPPPASSSRKMQGQIDNKHSIDSDEEEDDRKEHEKFEFSVHEGGLVLVAVPFLLRGPFKILSLFAEGEFYGRPAMSAA